MAKKSVKSQSGIGGFPMTNDDLVLLDNKSDKEIPNELLELQQRVPLYISALQGKAKPEINLSETSTKNSWSIPLEKNFAIGRVGMEVGELPRPKASRGKDITLKPNIPSWSGTTFHPKLSGSRTIRSFRNVKGKRITPHYIFGSDDRQVYYPKWISMALHWKGFCVDKSE